MSKELFSLGKIYPSDFLAPNEQPRCEPVELKLMMDDQGFVHLNETAPSDKMWGRYWYRSGINSSMKAELKDIVDSILKNYRGDLRVFCDIASNDGTLLSFVPKNIIRVGIDPADDSFKNEALKHADIIVQDYFSAEVYNNIAGSKSDVITCISMFYDLQDPNKFLKDVYEVLNDDGLFVMQMSYSSLMLKQMEFSNLCHEHFFYYSLKNLQSLLVNNGFKIMDAQINDCNCGSIRLYIMKQSGDETKFGSQPHRDVCNMRFKSLLHYELQSSIDQPSAWQGFYQQILALKQKTVDFIKEAKKDGKTVAALGASTKGNTLLQFYGLDNTLIDFISERSPAKFGLRTVGTNIPIISEEEARERKPDYMLILPFHFVNEFIDREKEYLNNGGRFIVPVPEFIIIGGTND
ncbi:MAG TPA: class I SAM-dependent methyltransferase [Bacteroidia bacterium]|nr:class I SAM-dependent methyltransferase [Bacteroidia bacterium]